MKKLYYFGFIIGLLSILNPAFCQVANELEPGYYVVVSAYAKSRENVAQNYVEVLKLKGYKASYGFNSSRNLYFAYLHYFDNLKASLQEMRNTRSKGEFKEAWVRVIPGDIIEAPLVTQAPVPVEKVTPIGETVATETAVKEIIVEDPDPIIDNPEIKQYPVMTLGNTEVFLSLYNARNNRIVDGTVVVIDTDRSKQLTKVPGNEYLVLPDPKSKSGQLTLVCDAFGYRKVQQEINYPLPLADTVKSYIDLMGTTLVIKFDLIRYHKGDIGTLYNVYFYNDASIMRPESKFELNSLLQMMQENPKYKIRLHGHSNGNYHGKIISMGPDKDFFSLDGSKQGVGSAKDLSGNRAEIIKEYLVANGVEASRMEVKAWGGKRPLYDKHSVNAQKNVRVEVEILEE
ncbi:MAG TPA: OmpA family protein [Chryseolinea sp.]|nr:OmpA family protein [Chryseolinea sp.]HPM30287.1 OmpA family protein [Chryseolinea sp.]